MAQKTYEEIKAAIARMYNCVDNYRQGSPDYDSMRTAIEPLEWVLGDMDTVDEMIALAEATQL